VRGDDRDDGDGRLESDVKGGAAVGEVDDREGADQQRRCSREDGGEQGEK
jgi:hypothetical protein